MFIVENDIVYLTRGDDVDIEVQLEYDDEERTPYEMQTGDTLTLTIRKEPRADSPVLLTEMSSSEVISVGHDATGGIEAGWYSMDIQLTTAAGRRTTVWPKLPTLKRPSALNFKNFCMMAEVTTNGES